MWLNNVTLENTVIEKNPLELGDKEALYYLGPNLTLRSCTLVLKVPAKRLLLRGLQLIDCAVEVKKELKELSWYEAHLKGCRFTGRLFGCDFGHKPDPGLPHREGGGIEDCDFSAAHLHACRFVGCDPSTLCFPRWPHFTILEPFRRRQEFASMTWPREIRGWFSSFEMYPKTTAAVVFSATALAKEAGISEDRLRALLEGHTDVS